METNNHPEVYIGTYKKYNVGSLFGEWIDLTKFEKYEDFVAYCNRLHKDEAHPELMCQDNSNMPDGVDFPESFCKDDFDTVIWAHKLETGEITDEYSEDDDEPTLQVIDYSEKSFAITGDTKPHADAFKELGGKWNPKLSCGAGWIFPKRFRDEVDDYLASGKVTAPSEHGKAKAGATEAKYKQWLTEAKEAGCDISGKVAAVKLSNGKFFLLKKEGLDNKFPFHDEGPNYEEYKRVTATNETKAEYFLAVNSEPHNYTHYRHCLEHSHGDDSEYCLHIDGNQASLDDRRWTPEYARMNVNDDDRKAINDLVDYGCTEITKRAKTYLKRYGVSKLRFWTYWADA